jgi:hypothetical protein
MSGHGLRRTLARVTAGKTMDRTEAVALLAARDQELEQLCRAASLVRDAGLATAGREGLITYSREVFVPLTRLCRDRCHCRGGSVRGRSRGARQSADVTEVADLDVIPFHPGVSGLNASLSAAEEAVRTLWGAIPLAVLPADTCRWRRRLCSTGRFGVRRDMSGLSSRTCHLAERRCSSPARGLPCGPRTGHTLRTRTNGRGRVACAAAASTCCARTSTTWRTSLW